MDIILIVLPIFLVLAVGKLLKQLKLIDDSFVMTANRLIFNFLLPVLLVYKISTSDFYALFNKYDMLVITLAIAVICLISFLAAKVIKVPKRSVGTFIMNNFRGNFAYLSLPVSYYAYGEEGLIAASILMAFCIPLVNILSIVVMNIGTSNRFSLQDTVKKTLLNPLIIGCALGLFFALFRITLPTFIMRTFAMISGVTLPLALFSIGATINLRQLKGNMQSVTVSVILKLFLLPFVGWLIFKGIHMPIGLTQKAAIILLAAPVATANYIFASIMGGDPEMARDNIIVTTLLSVVSFTLWLIFLGI